jgi:hypothetical protein
MKFSGSAIKHSDVPNLKEKIALNEIKKYSEQLEKSGPTYERYQSEYINVKRKNQIDNWRLQHAEYLQTNQWKTIRQKVLKRDNYLCQGCLEKPATEVHHKTYENWQMLGILGGYGIACYYAVGAPWFVVAKTGKHKWYAGCFAHNFYLCPTLATPFVFAMCAIGAAFAFFFNAVGFVAYYDYFNLLVHCCFVF